MEEEGDGLMVGGEMVLHGYVGGSFMDEGFTPWQVRRALAQVQGDLVVRLNSGGGSAWDGEAIRAALAGYDRGRVTVHVEGIAASAASLIAMAGDEIVMGAGAILMIHDPASLTLGDADAHRASAEMLDKLADSYARVYAARCGKSADEVRAMMRAETWMSAAEAVAAGFADRVEGEEEGGAQAAVAAFDFTVFANAPDRLRTLAEERGWRFAQPAEAVEAATKEVVMTTKTDPAADAKTAAANAAAAPAAAEMKADSKAIEAAVAAERERMLSIRRAVATVGLGDEFADGLIREGVTLDQANARIIDAWAQRGDRHEYGARPAEPKGDRLDERATMRAGLGEAMMAQMGLVSTPSDRARPYMDRRSLPAIAAALMGDNRPLDTFNARSEVLMAAFHTTSDFPELLENVLNKSLVSRYREAQPTYRRIARAVSFADFRPHPMVKMGDFPDLQEIGENGEIKFGTFGDTKESVLVKSYAIGAKLSRQVLINDTLMGIQQVLADRGRAVARFEDKTFYTMMLGGANGDGPTLLETSRQVFNTTDKTKASSNAAISVTTLSAGRAAMRKKTSVGGEALLDVSAALLLVGPDKETEAQQVVAPIQAQQAGNVNPFSGSLEVVTTARITGNSWYMFADPADVPCFVYGFLDGFEAPRVRIEEPFGQQGVALTIEHDFGCGAVDFRGGWKNAGA